MRNKLLKLTFMALCLSTSSALHAMDEDETAACSSTAATYAGMHEIRRNDSSEPTSGSVTLRQEGDNLILENFSLIPGSYYHNNMEKRAPKLPEWDPNLTLPSIAEDRRIANFVLSALPTAVIQLEFQGNSNGITHYAGQVPFGEEGRAPLHVAFRAEKSLRLGEMFELVVQSPYGIGNPAVINRASFSLFKVGSVEHDHLLRPWRTPTARSE